MDQQYNQSEYERFDQHCTVLKNAIFNAELDPHDLMGDIKSFVANTNKEFNIDKQKWLNEIIYIIKDRSCHKFRFLTEIETQFYIGVTKHLISIFQDLELYEELVNTINLTSIILYKQEDYTNALKLNKSAYVICKANKTNVFLGDVLMVKALLEIASAKFDKALATCKKAIDILKKNIDEPDQSIDDHFTFLYEKEGVPFSKFLNKKSQAETYYQLGLSNKGINFNTAAMEAFSMSLNIYKTFDDTEDYEMQKRQESQIRALSIINNSFQKEMAHIKEYVYYKHKTGRRPVGHISAPHRTEEDELILQHKIGEKIESYQEPYLQKLPVYKDMKAASTIADPVKRAAKREEEFLGYLENYDYSRVTNQSTISQTNKSTTNYSPDKSKKQSLPGPGYIREMKEKIFQDVKVRNAVKRDEAYRAQEGKTRAYVYKDEMVKNLPAEFDNLKYQMNNDHFQKMEYFADLDHKFCPKVEAPWNNPNLK